MLQINFLFCFEFLTSCKGSNRYLYLRIGNNFCLKFDQFGERETILSHQEKWETARWSSCCTTWPDLPARAAPGVTSAALPEPAWRPMDFEAANTIKRTHPCITWVYGGQLAATRAIDGSAVTANGLIGLRLALGWPDVAGLPRASSGAMRCPSPYLDQTGRASVALLGPRVGHFKKIKIKIKIWVTGLNILGRTKCF